MAVLTSRSVQNKWAALFVLWALHGTVALGEFLALPSFEVSLPFLLVSAFLFFWIVLNIGLVVFVYKNTSGWINLRDALGKPNLKDGLFVAAALMLSLQLVLGISRQLFGRQLMLLYGGYIDLLSPGLKLFAYVALEITGLVLFFNLRGRVKYKPSLEGFTARLSVVLLTLALATLVVSWTGLGIMQGPKGDWSRGLPAVPLLEWHIVLACLFCLGMVLLESNGKVLNFRQLDLWICLAVWTAAVLLWLGQPVVPNASALKPHEPNFEIYPFIDSQTYDEFAQSVLVGNGFGENRIPQRPLYIVFLVLMHVLVGQGYSAMIVLQSLFFALFPVLLYLFGREFLGRPVGISIALLAIVRDHVSNLVSPFTGNISYSKLYLSEIPTAIFLILFLLVGIRWIKAGFPVFLGFLLGGILGIGMLIRTQVVVALPVIFFFAFLTQPKKIAPLIKNGLLMSLAVLLAISPWLWRNRQISGEFIFDSPESQTANLALRYGRLNGLEPDITLRAGESNSEYNDRLKEMAFEAISSNPWGAMKALANSFLNHCVNNILLLPLRNELQNLGELQTPTDAFWQKWEGTPTSTQSLILVFYIFLFGLGLTAAWVRNGWLGFLPLVLNLLYNLWTSLALLSGQRFMLTMDWSIYLYYMIGLFTLMGGFLFILNGGRALIMRWYENNSSLPAFAAPEVQWRHYLLAGALFIGVGLSLPFSEMAFPQKYPPVSDEKILAELMSSPALEQAGFDPVCLQKAVSEAQLDTVQGRVLYPRYYAAGDGESFTDSVGYRIVDQGRLVFNMVGQISGRIIFPMSQSPDFFPNAADAILISSDDGERWFVLVQQGDTERFYVSESFDDSVCE